MTSFGGFDPFWLMEVADLLLPSFEMQELLRAAHIHAEEA
jgi:hypothetical protein